MVDDIQRALARLRTSLRTGLHGTFVQLSGYSELPLRSQPAQSAREGVSHVQEQIQSPEW